jgi:hypothetical protein
MISRAASPCEENLPARVQFFALPTIIDKAAKSLLIILASVLLHGCVTASPVTSSSTPAATVTVKGTVSSGGVGAAVLVTSALVTIYESGATSASTVGTATTDSSGKFSITFTPDGSGNLYYAIAGKGGNIELMALLGASPLSSVVINEMTTVASAYAMAQFLQKPNASGDFQYCA